MEHHGQISGIRSPNIHRNQHLLPRKVMPLQWLPKGWTRQKLQLLLVSRNSSSDFNGSRTSIITKPTNKHISLCPLLLLLLVFNLVYIKYKTTFCLCSSWISHTVHFIPSPSMSMQLAYAPLPFSVYILYVYLHNLWFASCDMYINTTLFGFYLLISMHVL